MRAFPLVILAVLSIALLAAFGCIQKPSEIVVVEPPVVEPPKNNTTVASPCSTGNIVQKDECFSSLAISKSDPELCRNVYSVEKVDSCYSHFAENNLEICKRISNAEQRTGCLTENAKRLNSTESESICNLIDNAESRAECLRQVVPPCRLVLDEMQRSLCIALEKNDYNYCSGDECFSKYAENTSDVNACSLISSPAEKYACIAVVKNDVGECKMAPLSPVQDYCVELSAKRLSNADGCDLATAGSDYRNRCYLDAAVRIGDGSVCARAEPEFSVGGGTSRNWCYMEYASRKGDVSVCPKVLESQNRIGCYYTAAKKNRMPSLCNSLGNEAWMRDCYSGSILYSEGGPVPSDCESVLDSIWKDKCYYKAALSTANSSLCVFITPWTSDSDSCDSAFGN
ncbi:TPA: hypothetical protein HA225_00440 [Candidatus Micrarchaeota archaeon]|nr:hypothetical protein [Candidatus Micrarchaeota archaeon]HIH30753.1 hypothetical protein [Candidatus Micrarchaeota archaeon]